MKAELKNTVPILPAEYRAATRRGGGMSKAYPERGLKKKSSG